MGYRATMLSLIAFPILAATSACDGEPKSYSSCLQRNQKPGISETLARSIDKNCKDQFTTTIQDDPFGLTFNLVTISAVGPKNKQVIQLRFINNSLGFVVRKFDIKHNNYTWTIDNVEIGVASSAVVTINSGGTDFLYAADTVFAVGNVMGYSVK